MNKTFDLHRFGMVLRWDLLTNRKSYFCSIAGLAIGIIMLSIPMLYNFPSSRVIRAGGDLSDYYRCSIVGFLAAIVILFFFISACNIFSNMKTKLQRESFMMLPANNLEKYAARFLMMSVGSIQWKNCSAVPMHRIFGRRYKSGIRNMQPITGNCMPCLEE